MIKNNTFSVLVTNYNIQREKKLIDILRGWLQQPIDELILLDCGNNVKLHRLNIGDERLQKISFTQDYGTKTDLAIANLTMGDFVILADDDVIPKKGFVKDLYDGWKTVGGGIVGIIGRTFHGPKYKGDTKYYRSSKIQKPVRVGFAGVIYLSPRKYFGFDTRQMPSRNVDDIYHQMEMLKGKVPIWVVPTKNYEDLPEASDNTAMFHTNNLRQIRYTYYRALYYKNKEIYEELWEQKDE